MTKKSVYVQVMKSLAVIAAIAYNSWFLTYFLNYDLDSRLAFVSEYASPTQHYSLVFRVLDIFTGSLVLIILLLFAVMRLKEKYKAKSIFEIKDLTVEESKFLSKKHFGNIVLLSGFAAFSVLTILDVVFPMQCPISATSMEDLNSHKCENVTNFVHEISSALVGVVIVALMLSVLLFRKYIFTEFYTRKFGVFWDKTKNFVFLLMIIHFISLAYTLVGVENPNMVWLGIGQRISIFSFSVWSILVFFSILEVDNN